MTNKAVLQLLKMIDSDCFILPVSKYASPYYTESFKKTDQTKNGVLLPYIYMLDPPSPHLPVMAFKSVHASFWVPIYFSSYNRFSTNVASVTLLDCYFHNKGLDKLPDFKTGTRHAMYTTINHSYSLHNPLIRGTFLSDIFFSSAPAL